MDLDYLKDIGQRFLKEIKGMEDVKNKNVKYNLKWECQKEEAKQNDFLTRLVDSIHDSKDSIDWLILIALLFVLFTSKNLYEYSDPFIFLFNVSSTKYNCV